MAEFLVYNKTHWMEQPSKERPDLLGYDNAVRKVNEEPMSSADRSKTLAKLWTKYTARYRTGDIVEVREDGYWSIKRKGHGPFALVIIPGMSLRVAAKYMDAHETDNDDLKKRIVVRRRKYQFDMTKISLDASEKAVTNISTIMDMSK